MNASAIEIRKTKSSLLGRLKEEQSFWSYLPSSVNEETISDELLIASVMRHLDLAEIKQLFQIFPLRKIKSAWAKILVPEGEYLHTLNRFLAWYCFDAKRPDAYLKSLQTRHFNKLLNT